VQASDRVARLRLVRFLLDAERAALGVELDHAIAAGIIDWIGEHGGAALAVQSLAHDRHEVVAKEDVVAEDQRNAVAADELSADEECLRYAGGPLLHGVREAHAPLLAVAQELLEARRVLRRRDD